MTAKYKLSKVMRRTVLCYLSCKKNRKKLLLLLLLLLFLE
eukprot:UN02408